MGRSRAIALILVIGLLATLATVRAAEPSPPARGKAAAPAASSDSAARPDAQKADGLGFLNYDSPKAPKSPGVGGMLAKLVVPLFGVIALIYLMAWFARKKLGIKGIAKGRGEFSEVVEVTPLGGQRYLYLVRVVDRLMVLGVAQDAISALGEISEEELSRSIQTGAARDFSLILQGVGGSNVAAAAGQTPAQEAHKSSEWEG